MTADFGSYGRRARRWTLAVIGAGLLAAAGGCGLLKEGRAWLYGLEAYIYGFPLIMMDLTKDAATAMLPPGWKYRVKVLDKDLGIGAINGVAHVTQDDLEDTYNACFEMDNQTNCTYKP